MTRKANLSLTSILHKVEKSLLYLLGGEIFINLSI